MCDWSNCSTDLWSQSRDLHNKLRSKMRNKVSIEVMVSADLAADGVCWSCMMQLCCLLHLCESNVKLWTVSTGCAVLKKKVKPNKKLCGLNFITTTASTVLLLLFITVLFLKHCLIHVYFWGWLFVTVSAENVVVLRPKAQLKKLCAWLCWPLCLKGMVETDVFLRCLIAPNSDDVSVCVFTLQRSY